MRDSQQKEAAKLKSFWSASRRAVRKANPQTTGSILIDWPMKPFPKARAAVASGTSTIGHMMERADIAAGKPLSRIPLVGGAFKTTAKKVKSTTRGARTRISDKKRLQPHTVTRTTEYPTAKITAPLTKSFKVLTPFAAFMGVHSLLSPPVQGELKMSSNGTCGHEALLRKNSEMLKVAAEEIAQLRTERDLLLKEYSQALYTSEAEKIASDMVERGLIPEEERLRKVAEIISGNKKLSAVKEALAIVQPGRVPPIGQLEGEQGPGEADQNEAIDFLWHMQ